MANLGTANQRAIARSCLILTDREIKNSMAARLIEISPSPADTAYASTSVDLTLAESLRIFKESTPGAEMTIEPRRPGYNIINVLREITETASIDKDAEKGFLLKPRQLILAWTIEKVHLKEHARVAARVEGKSSLARLGLAIHVTAPTIHAGFQGPIQLEMINHGHRPIRLAIGMPICQLIFEQTLGMPDKAYQGQFLGQNPAKV